MQRAGRNRAVCWSTQKTQDAFRNSLSPIELGVHSNTAAAGQLLPLVISVQRPSERRLHPETSLTTYASDSVEVVTYCRPPMALLLARIYEVFPLPRPKCGDIRMIATLARPLDRAGNTHPLGRADVAPAHGSGPRPGTVGDVRSRAGVIRSSNLADA